MNPISLSWRIKLEYIPMYLLSLFCKLVFLPVDTNNILQFQNKWIMFSTTR